MRVKILRTLGKNLPAPLPEEVDVTESMDKDGPLTEGQVRDNLSDKCCHYLIRNGLAEETTEDVTPKEPVHAKQPVGTVAPKPSNFNQNPHGPEVKKDK